MPVVRPTHTRIETLADGSRWTEHPVAAKVPF